MTDEKPTEKQADYNLKFDDELEGVEAFNLDNPESTQAPVENSEAIFKVSEKPIKKDMLIAEIVEEHPELVPLIMDYGVHCVGCGASTFETLEEGFTGHGLDDEEVDQIVIDLNEYIKQVVGLQKNAEQSPL